MTSRSALVATFCLFLAACGHQDLEIEGEEPSLEGPEEVSGSGILLEDDLPLVTYTDVEEGFVIEGDVLVPRDGLKPVPQGLDVGTTRSALMSLPRRHAWPNGRIPFQFAEDVGPAMREMVREAMLLWESTTPVRFVRRSGEADFIHIRAWDGRYSYATIGHAGGRQFVTIQRNSVGTSWGRGLVAHELGHTMGLHHEHKRIDRDEHVTIHWDNIKDGLGSNFRTYNGLELTTYNVGSIMHYGSNAFSRNGKPTITRKDGTRFRQNFDRPTQRDADGVTKLYQ